MTFSDVLKAAVLAGFIAGAATAVFHSILTERVIDQAIEIEESRSQSQGEPAKEPVVSRTAQRGGLIFGFLLYGVVWGLLFGVLLYLTHSWLPASTDSRRGLVLAVLLGWSVTIFPFLKYPANPPGVGDPETIGYRQATYLGFIGLSIVGTILGIVIQRRLSPAKRLAWPTASFFAVYLVLIYWLMPPNPDPIPLPSQTVWTFRALSLTGHFLFWGVMGGMFAWLLKE